MTTDQHKKYIWHFLRAHFEENCQLELLNLLGYRVDDVNNKLSQLVGNLDVNNLSDGISNLNTVNCVYFALNEGRNFILFFFIIITAK